VSADQKLRRSEPERCPHCGVNLEGDPIPAESQHHYGATHFSRVIGLYDRGLDRTTAWRCPDCNGEWPR